MQKGEIAQNKNPLIARFQLLSAASLNLGWSQNGVLGNGLKAYFSRDVNPVQNSKF